MLATPEFWVAVAFVILVAAIARPLYRAVVGGLDARTERIRHTLDEATRLREEAQHLLAEYQRKQRDAARECEEIVAHTEAEAKRFTEEAAARLEATLARREQLAIDKIAQTEAEAVQEVRVATVDIAIAATRRLLAQRTDAGQAELTPHPSRRPFRPPQDAESCLISIITSC